jgi:hypothetical protein
MHSTRSPQALGVIVAALAACASGRQAAAVSASDASRANDASVLAESASVAWRGNLQPVQQQTGSISPRGNNRVFGTVVLTPARSSPNRMRARITVSTQLLTSARLRWALVGGRCGSADIPVTGVEQFPEIPVSSNGRGDIDTEVPVVMPTSGSYHVNIFWSNGSDVSDVMTCANLRLERSSNG